MGTCIINFVKPVGDPKQQQNMFESMASILKIFYVSALPAHSLAEHVHV